MARSDVRKKGVPGSKNPLAKAASKGGYKLPPQTRKSYSTPQARKLTCGAKRHGGGICGMTAGWGTSHPGIGRCKYHGGSMPTHVMAAATEEHRRLLGVPMEINPLDALL